MSNEDQLEVAGRVLDSLSTGKKIGLYVTLAGLLAAAFWGGYKVADMRAANEMAELRAKHERELTAASREVGIGIGIDVVRPDADLPSYADAEPSDVSMADMADIYDRHRENSKTLTSIHQRPPFTDHVGARLKWTGFVSDVSASMFDSVPHYIVSFRPLIDQPYKFQRSAYFVGEHHEEMARALVPDQPVTISGVLNEQGNLTQCKFVHIGDPPTVAE